MLTLDLVAILVLASATLLYAAFVPPQGRAWALLVGSVVVVYWLQPPLPIRFSDFILPTATIVLTAACWTFTRRPDDPAQAATAREDRLTLLVLGALIAGLSLFRFIDADYRLTAGRPPEPLNVVLSLAAVGAAVGGIHWLTRGVNRTRVLTAAILLVALVFVLLKSEPLATAVSRWWRGQTGQDASLASAADLGWLGFSYVAFRLIHTLRDRQTGLLPVLSLREFVTYVLFFPAFVAGPIDRAERFVVDYRQMPHSAGLDAARIGAGLARIVMGLFKKFVVADTLALGLALNPVNVNQVQAAPWLWLLLYGYAFRLYFDFAGYTDVAIGLGLLVGLRLPENFDRPYRQTNLTAFWQSWHITLSQWARFYVFTPLSRWLLRRDPRPSPTLIVLAAQLATMAVIGLWHGITWNFLIWGLWHGLGLFVHKQWSDRTRRWYRRVQDRPLLKRLWTFAAWFITFHYVVLGWVWFLLPDTGQALQTLIRLFGW